MVEHLGEGSKGPIMACTAEIRRYLDRWDKHIPPDPMLNGALEKAIGESLEKLEGLVDERLSRK